MCGLCGVASKTVLFTEEVKAFKDLLYISSMRGKDSTGVLAVDTRGKTTTQRLLDDSPCFLDYYGGPTGFISKPSNRLLMGHCRSATLGSVTRKNIHPFDVGRFIGAHNGTLYSSAFIPGKNDYRTDSEILLRHMVDNGIQETLEKLRRYDAFALEIYEPSTKMLYLSRNTERSLYIGIRADQNVVFWASELAMLAFINTKYDLKLEFYKVMPFTILKFDLDNMSRGSMYSLIELKEPEQYTVVSRTVWGNEYQGSFDDWEWDAKKKQYVPVGTFASDEQKSRLTTDPNPVEDKHDGDLQEDRDRIPF